MGWGSGALRGRTSLSYLGAAQAVAAGVGDDDAEGEPVDDDRGQARVRESGVPFANRASELSDPRNLPLNIPHNIPQWYVGGMFCGMFGKVSSLLGVSSGQEPLV